MRVLHVINALGGGGRERRMSQVVASLRRTQSCDQEIITFAKEDSYKVFEDLRIPTHVITQGRLERIKTYIKIIKAFKPQVVHLWLETPTELLFFSLAKYRFHYKLIAGFVADANIISGFNTYTMGIKCAFLCADRIVSNSVAGLKAKNAPLSKSTVIYNGFDFHRFPEGINKTAKRHSLGVGSDTLVVMSASMKPTKDWLSFVNTAKVLADKGLDATFIAIGSGPMLEGLRAHVLHEKINNVVFLGYRNDVEEILLASDVFMLYTNNDVHAEGVSNAILEAMAAGLPVVATRGGGTAEIIEDKKNGYIIEPKMFEDGAKKVESLINNHGMADYLGENARETVCSKFSIEEQNSKYVDLYKGLLNL